MHKSNTIYQDIKQMGNKVGLHADNQTLRLVYGEEDIKYITFIQSLQSKYLSSQIKFANLTIFFFQFPIAEFIALSTSQRVQVLRKQYQDLVQGGQLLIRTDRSTINRLEQNKELYAALQNILLKQIKLREEQDAQISLEQTLKILNNSSQQFYRYPNCFPTTRTHNFENSCLQEKQYLKTLPDKFVLIVMKSGISAYLCEKDKKIERIGGSIIGQKTYLSLLNFKYPGYTLQEYFDLGFKQGNLKEVDIMLEDIYDKNQNLGFPGELLAGNMGKLAKLNPEQLKNINPASIIRSMITALALTAANVVRVSLQQSHTTQAIFLADQFHDEKFYGMVQAHLALYEPKRLVYFGKHAPFLTCLGKVFTQ